MVRDEILFEYYPIMLAGIFAALKYWLYTKKVFMNTLKYNGYLLNKNSRCP